MNLGSSHVWIVLLAVDAVLHDPRVSVSHQPAFAAVSFLAFDAIE
jgi:hypothetical protein